MSHYRKLVACLVGLAALFVKDRTGLDLTAQQDLISTIVIDGLTAASVWFFANGPRV